MNETLYRWTFNFRKVVRQQNSGAAKDFILPYSTVYLRIQKWKNYWNRSVFAKVIHQRITAYFFEPPCRAYVSNKKTQGVGYNYGGFLGSVGMGIPWGFLWDISVGGYGDWNLIPTAALIFLHVSNWIWGGARRQYTCCSTQSHCWWRLVHNEI